MYERIPRPLVYFMTVLCMLFFGLSFVWVKIVYKYYPPFAVIFARLVISSCLLWVLCRVLSDTTRIAREDYRELFLLALFEPFLYFLGESLGLKYVSATVASLIVATIPVFTPFFAWLVLKERMNRFGMAGLFISVAGILVLVLDGGMRFTCSVKGLCLMFLAVIGAVGYNIVCGRMIKKYSPLSLVRWQNLIGAFLFLPLLFGGDLQTVLSVPLNREIVFCILCLAIFPSTLSFFFYNISVSRIGVNKSNIFTYLVPVFAGTFSFFVLGEPFDLKKLCGMAVIITGVVLSQLRPGKKGRIMKSSPCIHGTAS